MEGHCRHRECYEYCEPARASLSSAAGASAGAAARIAIHSCDGSGGCESRHRRETASVQADKLRGQGAYRRALHGQRPRGQWRCCTRSSEDDLLASYRERLDAEGGATSFRLRGDATRALQEVREGGSKALNSTKAFVDWDSTKASAAQVPPSLACSLSSLPGPSPPPARSPKRSGVNSLPRRGRVAACSTRTAGGSLS